MQNLPLQCKHLPRHLQLVGHHDTPPPHTHTHLTLKHPAGSPPQKNPRQLLPTYFSVFFLLLMFTFPPMPRQLQVPQRRLSGRYSFRKELWEGISNILDYTQYPECKLQTSHQEVIPCRSPVLQEDVRVLSLRTWKQHHNLQARCLSSAGSIRSNGPYLI